MSDKVEIMRAVQYEAYGRGAAGLKHVEVPVPKPKQGQLLVKVQAVAINPADWKVQKGLLRPFLPSKFPFIPGLDVAGEVCEVGPGVKNFKPGDEVVGALSATQGGGMAEFVVVKETFAVPRPPEVSAADGAALPIAAVTAHLALTQAAGLKLDGSSPERNILVTAASGGVGVYAVQLAKLGNAHVTATCGARNIDLIKSLGADEVLDYKTPEGTALESPSGKKYDSVINCASGIPWSTFEPNLSERGKVIDIAPSFSSMMTFVMKKLTFSRKQLQPLAMMFNEARAADLDFLVKLVKEKQLKTIIDSRHPLSKAEEGWEKSMSGHATGKIIIEP